MASMVTHHNNTVTATTGQVASAISINSRIPHRHHQQTTNQQCTSNRTATSTRHNVNNNVGINHHQ
jgi:hypothetical protein